jgi:hypothetical protein
MVLSIASVSTLVHRRLHRVLFLSEDILKHGHNLLGKGGKREAGEVVKWEKGGKANGKEKN